MSKEIISKLNELDNGLRKLSTERKVVLPHHKTFELVDELREIVQKMRSFSDAIIIGSKTLKIDKPSLSAKNISMQPKYKVVLNTNPTNPERYRTLESESNIIVFCEKTPSDLSNWNGIEFIEISSKGDNFPLLGVP